MPILTNNYPQNYMKLQLFLNMGKHHLTKIKMSVKLALKIPKASLTFQKATII